MVHTSTGGILSFVMFFFCMIYATLKLIQLLGRDNPNVTKFLENNVYDYRDKLDLNEAKFRIAFSVEGFHDRKVRDDPRYVKYLARLYGRRDGERIEY